MSSQKGFTLIELIITLAVLAIIASIAAPSFQTVISNNRVTSQANALLAGVQYARSEAVRQARTVTFNINGTDWCVFTGADCATGTPLRTGTVSAAVQLIGVTTYSFNARGERQTPNFTTGGATASTTLHPPNCTTGDIRARNLNIGIGGRASVSQEGCP